MSSLLLAIKVLNLGTTTMIRIPAQYGLKSVNNGQSPTRPTQFLFIQFIGKISFFGDTNGYVFWLN